MAKMSIRKAALLADGRSRACAKCPVKRLNPNMCMQCSSTFVEGFTKGVKFARKCDREHENVTLQPCGENYTLYGLNFNQVQAIIMALEIASESSTTIKDRFYASHYKKQGDIALSKITTDIDNLLK